MPFVILLLFIAVPIAEIALFVEIGSEIGTLWTVIAIIATAVVGTALVRHQGLNTLAEARAAAARDEVPVGTVLSGLCILIAGVLLLTPGFLTDAVGFLLLIPIFRRWLLRAAVARVQASGRFQMHTQGFGRDRRGPVIDGVYEDLTQDDPNTDGPLGADSQAIDGPEDAKDPSSPWNRDDSTPPKR